MAVKQHYQVAYCWNGRCSHLIVMYIEDLIHFATRSGPYLFTKNPMPVTVVGHDHTILASLSDQLLYNSNHLTERQGQLAIRLLSKYRTELRPHVATVDEDLDTPKWKHPFRVLPKSKNLTIDKDRIHVEFPFETDVVETFRKRNSEVHELHKGIWDVDLKKWSFSLTEKNIEWLGSILANKGFQIDPAFIELYQATTKVFEDIENHLPMLVQTDTGFSLKNCHKNIPQPSTDNLVEALFWAREYGITTWDDAIDTQLKTQVNPVTRTILAISNRKHPWVDSSVYSVESFTDLLAYGGPAMVIIPGGSELELVKTWAEFAYSLGISTQQMSVMFRLPNEQAEFNKYVKQAELNNPVDANTRLVFVSTKITKPLIKAGIKFNTVINLGYYNYMHFSMSTVVDNARNLVYYSMKTPAKNNRWQPHELS